MSLYIESIQLHDGHMCNLAEHQRRFERTRAEVLGLHTHPQLSALPEPPPAALKGLFKCRVIYSKEIEVVEYQPYVRRRIGHLQLIRGEHVTYNYKSADRQLLDQMLALRGQADDIIIVKQGCLTDSSAANIALLKEGNWYTPDTPLLAGTMRAKLLGEDRLRAARIRVNDLDNYESLKLINAMNGLEYSEEIPVAGILRPEDL